MRAVWISGCKGFSLIEALIVLAILGIVGTLTISNMWAARPHAQLERGEVMLTAFLAAARNTALSQEIATRVVFNSAGEYWTENYDRTASTWTASTAHQTLPTGVSFPSGGNTFPSTTVSFTPRGTLLAGGTITLVNSKGETYAITGNLATGRFSPGGGNLR